MEVMVHGHANAFLRSSRRQNVKILGSIQSNLHDVDCIEAALSQQGGGAWRKSLIQQNGGHATRSRPKLSSSTLAAA